jgi:hypothetical protein
MNKAGGKYKKEPKAIYINLSDFCSPIEKKPVGNLLESACLGRGTFEKIETIHEK